MLLEQTCFGLQVNRGFLHLIVSHYSHITHSRGSALRTAKVLHSQSQSGLNTSHKVIKLILLLLIPCPPDAPVEEPFKAKRRAESTALQTQCNQFTSRHHLSLNSCYCPICCSVHTKSPFLPVAYLHKDFYVVCLSSKFIITCVLLPQKGVNS